MSLRACRSFAVTLALGACSSPAASPPTPDTGTARVDAFDVPVAGLAPSFLADFNDGDLSFGTPLRESDGLGPLYTRSACSSCHDDGVRGPGLVQKMSVVEADGVTPAADQSVLAFGHTLHPLVAGGGRTPILAPADDPSVRVTERVGPPVLGRGYLEAVRDDEIERVEAEQASRSDGIHGRINWVRYGSEANEDTRFHDYQKGDTLIGRFGLKARVAALDDFTADAFQSDMGITSPLRPTELDNPDGLTDDDKPGIDVDFASVNERANYVRAIAIPARPTDGAGAALFDAALCSVCHVPSLRTRADYPIAVLADIDAPVYTDLLLHRMSDELADGLPADPSVDGQADSFSWRTAPLIGLRFDKTYLHDGRAKSIAEAIELHRGTNSEANPSADAFDALDPDDRQTLIDFVTTL